MTLGTFIWLGGSLAVVTLLYFLAIGSINSVVWRNRILIGEIITSLAFTSLPFIVTANFYVEAQWFLVTVGLMLALLSGRFVINRLHPDFLRTSTIYNVSTLLVLITIGVCVAGVIEITGLQFGTYELLLGFAIVSIVVASVLLGMVFWTLKHYKLRKINSELKLRDLPTVTLAIPARNEDNYLTECLQAALASDYPKLEILVLDDCSQDKTSQIIRSFAQDGVRFISGGIPSEDWVGKTKAYDTLAQQASGEYIVFISVHTTLSPQSISKLVAYALSNRVEMVSVLPQRIDDYLASNLFQQLRYFWQVALPLFGRRVPLAGACWMIRRSTLKKLGGFGSVRHKIIPEGRFARALFAQNLYRFIISNPELGISNAKKWTSQAECGIRILYPTLKRQPIFSLLAMWFILSLMVLPFISTLSLGVLGIFDPLFWLSLTASILLLIAYGLVIARSNPQMWPLALPLFPFVLIQEAALILISTVSYEFGEVEWKARNVCYPVINYEKSNYNPESKIGHKSHTT